MDPAHEYSELNAKIEDIENGVKAIKLEQAEGKANAIKPVKGEGAIFQIIRKDLHFCDLLEDLVLDVVIDGARVYLQNLFAYPEEGFHCHSVWTQFCDDIVDAIVQILRFMVKWAPKLSADEAKRKSVFMDLLRNISYTVMYSMNKKGWFDPMDDSDLDLFSKHHDGKLNELR